MSNRFKHLYEFGDSVTGLEENILSFRSGSIATHRRHLRPPAFYRRLDAATLRQNISPFPFKTVMTS